jgi:hypothetical protein
MPRAYPASMKGIHTSTSLSASKRRFDAGGTPASKNDKTGAPLPKNHTQIQQRRIFNYQLSTVNCQLTYLCH